MKRAKNKAKIIKRVSLNKIMCVVCLLSSRISLKYNNKRY